MKETILVTGASGGFGRLITKTLINDGHTVIATMRDPGGRNRASGETLEAVGAHLIEMDVTDDSSVAAAVDKALAITGTLGIVVNNAGVGVLGLQETFTPEDWRRLFDINVFGVQRVNRAVLPHMRDARKGLLIHVSSLLGRMVIPFYGPYNASKFALEAMADNYRVELSSFGIESVLVEPGGYGTEFVNNLIRPSDHKRSAGYGEMSKAPDAALAAFEMRLHGPGAPDPQWVADAIAEIVRLPRGKRPFRTVVDRLGLGAAIEPYNSAIEKIQEQIYSAFGMAAMLRLNM